MSACFIFPNNLFEEYHKYSSCKEFILWECPQFFTGHAMKLVLLRAAMQEYHRFLLNNGNHVSYVGYKDTPDFDQVKESFSPYLKQWDSFLKKKGIPILNSPFFLTKNEEFQEYVKIYTKEPHKFRYFYKDRRIKLNIQFKKTQTKDIKSYDEENRLKGPRMKPNLNTNFNMSSETSPLIARAQKYVRKYFPNAPGSLNLYLPIDFPNAKKHFSRFLKERLKVFGPYQDMFSLYEEDSFILVHSIISPLLNIGLLTPDYIVKKVLEAYHKHVCPINSCEGFIRQIIGWREYMYLGYLISPPLNFRGDEFWSEKIQKLSQSNDILKFLTEKALKYGYLHHIERLMIVGNYFLLKNVSVDDAYKWFMALFIDAYEWVMVGNIYHMVYDKDQKRHLMTKPYLASDVYLRKMGHIPPKFSGALDEFHELYHRHFYVLT